MYGFLGEHDCKLDSKGRLRLPAALKKQLQAAAAGRFVVNRGFEKCLVLYPYDEWQKISQRVNSLNTFEKKKRLFVRYFYRGATELVLDTNDRLNIPNHLLKYAEISKELFLASRQNVIEIWNKEHYEEQLAMDSDTFADLAEEVMGDNDLSNNGDDN